MHKTLCLTHSMKYIIIASACNDAKTVTHPFFVPGLEIQRVSHPWTASTQNISGGPVWSTREKETRALAGSKL